MMLAALSISDLRLRLLEAIARDRALPVTLPDLCHWLEAAIPGSVIGVTVLDRASQVFEQAFFPSLPPVFSDSIKGAVVARLPGSCAHAVYHGTAVIAQDITADSRFVGGWKELNRQHGIGAIRSDPVTGKDGIVLGTLVVAFAAHRELTSDELRYWDAGLDLAGIALERDRELKRQELLLGELSHRASNLFSTIGALVYSTLRKHSEPREFRRVFEARLMTLARAHKIVLESLDVSLQDLLVDILAPYSLDHSVQIHGPGLRLTQEAAVAFSMAAHELATNAVKYGAFSSQDGVVDVSWALEERERDTPVFKLVWKESGGPVMAHQPHISGSGLGRRTIEKSLAMALDGTVDMDFAPDGLVCTVRAPVSPRLGTILS